MSDDDTPHTIRWTQLDGQTGYGQEFPNKRAAQWAKHCLESSPAGLIITYTVEPVRRGDAN